MNHSHTPIRGSIVALVTPMLDDGAVDYPSLRRLIDWHIAEGTDCIGVVGTTGESPTVSVDEHCEIIRVAVEQAKTHGAKAVPLTHLSPPTPAQVLADVSPRGKWAVALLLLRRLPWRQAGALVWGVAGWALRAPLPAPTAIRESSTNSISK